MCNRGKKYAYMSTSANSVVFHCHTFTIPYLNMPLIMYIRFLTSMEKLDLFNKTIGTLNTEMRLPNEDLSYTEVLNAQYDQQLIISNLIGNNALK